MRNILHRVEQAINVLLAICIAGMSILIFSNVIFRYVFHSGITWAEEMSRFLFVWMVFLGSILALKEGTHIGMDMLVRRLPEKYSKVLVLIGNVLMLALSFLLLGGSWKMTMDSVDSAAPATGISLAFMYGVGILMSIGMILITFINIFIAFKPVNQDGNNSSKA